MLYSTIVDKNEQGLQMISDAAEKFEQGRYLYAIYNCHLSKEEVLGITAYVKEYRARLSREHLALAKFALTFNKEYATENNGCFVTAERLFYKIRSTISGSKKIYKSFCRTIKKRLPPTALQSSVFKRSELVNDYYTGQLFGMESYDECVSMLYDELEGFFVELVKCLALCRMIITEESIIRSTPERCIAIYRDCYEQMVSNSRMMVLTFKESNLVPYDEMDERRKKAGSLQNFICSNYHVLDPSQFQMHVVVSELNKGNANGLTPTETNLFGPENIELVKKVRLVIEHFDELEEGTKGKNENKHSAYCVASFMRWSGIGIKPDTKVKAFVEEYFNKTYRGKYPPVKTNAVNTAKNNISYGKTDFDNDGFCTKIEGLVERYTANKDITIKKASNF